MRELDTRVTDGVHVRLLWSETEHGLSVVVTDTKTGEAFSIEVRDEEHPIDVFHHPYAYAAWHGIEVASPARFSESEWIAPLAA
jgi:hypothetical protein